MKTIELRPFFRNEVNVKSPFERDSGKDGKKNVENEKHFILQTDDRFANMWCCSHIFSPSGILTSSKKKTSIRGINRSISIGNRKLCSSAMLIRHAVVSDLLQTNKWL